MLILAIDRARKSASEIIYGIYIKVTALKAGVERALIIFDYY